MKTRLASLLVFVFLISCQSGRSSDFTAMKNRVSMQNLETHVSRLAQMDRHSSDGRETARLYITEQLQAYGYNVNRQPFRQGTHQGVNLVATKPGSSGPVGNEVFVVGAHYDAVAGTPGADDNASGVAGLLEIARVCSGCQFNRTLEFVAFDLEEEGLVGSVQYVAKAQTSPNTRNIVGSLILEMIAYTQDTQETPLNTVPNRSVGYPSGRATGDFILALANSNPLPAEINQTPCSTTASSDGTGQATAPTSEQLLDRFHCASKTLTPALPIVAAIAVGNGTRVPSARRSDHAPFWDEGIASLMITDTSNFRSGNSYYHTPEDKPCILDYAFHRKVVQASLLTCLDFAQPQTLAVPVQLAPPRVTVNYSIPLLAPGFYSAETDDASNDLEVETGYMQPHDYGVAFWATRQATGQRPGQRAVFLVNAYYPQSFRRITDFETSPPGSNPRISWTPDESSLVTGTRIVQLYEEVKQLRPLNLHGKTFKGVGTYTSLPSGNWYFDVVGGNIWALPVILDGTEDTSRSPLSVTNFPTTEIDSINSVAVAENGTSLTFAGEKRTTHAGQTRTTHSIYAIPELNRILNSSPKPSTEISSAAPTMLTDSAVIALHRCRSPGSALTLFQNGSLVSFTDDCGSRDTDVFVRDINGRTAARRVSLTGNQGPATPILGGTRMIAKNLNGKDPILSIANLRVTAAVTNGKAVTIMDGNGSSVEVSEGTEITFPRGSAEELFLETPVRQVDFGRFTNNLRGTDAIRTIGPYGTTFDEPITVTIKYSNTEFVHIPAASRHVVGFDKETNLYNRVIPQSDMITTTDANTISFKVSYASSFVLAFGDITE